MLIRDVFCERFCFYVYLDVLLQLCEVLDLQNVRQFYFIDLQLCFYVYLDVLMLYGILNQHKILLLLMLLF